MSNVSQSARDAARAFNKEARSWVLIVQSSDRAAIDTVELAKFFTAAEQRGAATAQAEIEEQARLLGMSAERELALRSEIERLRADVARWRLASQLRDVLLHNFVVSLTRNDKNRDNTLTIDRDELSILINLAREVLPPPRVREADEQQED